VNGKRIGVGALVVRYASRLRFPYLFLATAILFMGDLIFPDLVPFADEILLGLLTALFGTWRRRRVSASKDPVAEEGVAGSYDHRESD
jgi:ABC-type uncharacterized transport system YnjBCD ATPase subunit